MAVRVEPAVMQLGNLPDNQLKEFEYTVTNDSQSTVSLSTWASCGCTRPTINKEILGPGESTKLRAVFDAFNKKGLQDKTLGVNYLENNISHSIAVKFIAKVVPA